MINTKLHRLSKLKLGLSLAATLLMTGCMQTTLSPSTDASMTSRDRQLLANPPYVEAQIPEQYRRHVVDYDRPEPPGAILVDSDAHYLYYVLPDHKALRYGVAVGEEAMAFSGTATVGRKAEWPDWVPTSGEQARLGPFPKRVPGGSANPLGARALSLSGQHRHAVPNPRHQPAGIYRPVRLVRLHPHDQCRRDRPVRSRQDGHNRRRPAV
jgi:lipoprotein-anchoring transpeptidase ErfK/SrfK